MSLLDNGFKAGGSVLVGAGVVILAPLVLPVIASVAKSVAKATIKGGMIAYQKAKIATAETIEGLEDIAAEAKAEIAEKPQEAKE